MAIRYPRGKGTLSDWHCDMKLIEIGRGEKLADGSDVAVITIGTVAANAAKAIEMAAADGISAAHYDMMFLKPLDDKLLQEIAATRLPIITVEDGSIMGGLGSAVAEWLMDNKLPGIRLIRLGLPDKFIPQGTPAQLAAMCGIDADAIYQAIMDAATSDKTNSK